MSTMLVKSAVKRTFTLRIQQAEIVTISLMFMRNMSEQHKLKTSSLKYAFNRRLRKHFYK